ncbi:methyltransferase [Alloalcanivorax mobilis]|uniref:methyltransferase n=1 Tax=Alloalcanivorax mobilis TaxID=2019569 RepID=UPI000C788B9D|nr:methyltransferase [Alloalcanivorax mobilis]
MENSTRLLWRQQDSLASRRVLVVEANDPALADLPADRIYLHADDYGVGAHQWAPLPTLPEDVDLVILPLPKAVERLELLLRSIAGSIESALEVWLVGPAKGGIRGGTTRLARYADDVTLVDSARHCKLYRARLRPGPALSLSDVESLVQVGDLQVVSYPGVFSHGRLDQGTALLLDALQENLPREKVLDMGCGSGVISAVLAHAGCQVSASDVSATAVAAATATLQRNALQGRVVGGDLYSGVSGRHQALITNPPFHDGRERTTAITRRLIEQAPGYLTERGEMWMVANRELPYAQWLDGAFRHVQVVRETNRFRVYRALR